MLPKFGLQLTLFGAMLAGGLALGLVSLGGYYLATGGPERLRREVSGELPAQRRASGERPDRKSTRLNSSHGYISYAVFCLKKKKKNPPLSQPITATSPFWDL